MISARSNTYEEARALLERHGFTQLYMSSHVRHYFMKPDGELNEFGAPMEHATITFDQGLWLPTVFEFKGRKANSYKPALRLVGGTDTE